MHGKHLAFKRHFCLPICPIFPKSIRQTGMYRLPGRTGGMQGNGSQRMIAHSGKNIENQQQELKIIKDTPGIKMSKSARPGLPESLIPEPNQKAAAGPAAF
ncbi:hypothetical protein [Heyndrickxia coagulans]|uniref:hypothetical protein n=1 Tax=Heyndrickxia coagulans TaxID=1398 RepID=UPI002E20DACA|nr:hypothetical protein [Heyndrickxia coagulans]